MEEKTKKIRNKKLWIPVIVFLLLALLFVPIPTGTMNDGGTRVYSAVTYKIVKWRRLVGIGRYEKTRVYFFPNNFKSMAALWELENVDEKAYAVKEESFEATVLEVSEGGVMVEPLEGEWERKSSDKIGFPTQLLADIGVEPGDIVEIVYNGTIRESYPAQIVAKRWKFSEKNRELSFERQWLDTASAENWGEKKLDGTEITRIYADCFFMNNVKVNGSLSADWCVGDFVVCTCKNMYYDAETGHYEGDLVTIEPYVSDPNDVLCAKPVIYFYPEEETKVTVSLAINGALTCTYPAYDTGWTVTASPDGILTDAQGQTYNYLYWEGEAEFAYDFAKGFCVKGEETAAFLENALAKLGLTRREANEFIVYWLPMMEQNPYNIISFQTENYTEAAKLTVSPTPDTLLRVFMAWKGADTFTELPEQELTAPERTGFTVVEWGGTEVK
jgi:hypothetical protein